MKSDNSKFSHVYTLVKKIPEGRVATYGQISSMLNEKWQMKNDSRGITPRVVGWALHANKDSNVPCHRVVNGKGGLAPNFAFNGYKEQRRRLITEGVDFVDEMHVDLGKHLWQMK